MEASAQLAALHTGAAFISLGRYTKTFDMFKVMGVSSKELVHSNILAALLCEEETHGMGSLFRDAYVYSLAHMPCSGKALTLEVLDRARGARANIARELAHIDILLDYPDLRLVIAIENKIWAADRKNQVARYQKTLSDLYPHYAYKALVYLTPKGRGSPTQDPESSVPVYNQSYGQLARLLRQQQIHATATASYFIDQFTSHVEKTMSGNSELNELCWNVFQESEDAYAHLVDHYQYCKTRKLTELFARLRERLATDCLFEPFKSEMVVKFASNPDKQKYDLDIRLRSWPEGVWVKVYKHTWFGVFPFFRADDLEHLISRLPSFTQPAYAVHDWEGLYFASTRFFIKKQRCVLEEGDRVTDAHIDEVLTRVNDCVVEINGVLNSLKISGY
ncbi:PD-(D/E)XK nuclease family protein [Pseudomonas zeae]|uniref:PD-(D/E)XK nuclease family protein n=1 Tax=Pseudomonas zeae TaxID=2745510 RepID=A0A9E6NJF2_9PSED|nr:PD-(D/E)XK nuclease family protein [Pseudomonas zeae]QXI09178.1 PD-(D/E)XK nuclease family protein [Pseudomonas zeae]